MNTSTKKLVVHVIGESASATATVRNLGKEVRTTGERVRTTTKHTDKFAESVTKVGEKTKGMTSRIAGGILGAVGLQYAIVGLAEGIKGMVDEAIDMEKTQARVNQLFGKGAPAITKWADSAATSLGLSKNQAETSAAMFALYGRQANLTGKTLVSFSEKNTKLAVDLASFKNVDPSIVFKAMQNAMAGNYRGLKQFGIVLSAADVKNEALKLGLIKTTKDALTPQARVLATNVLLNQKASFATGNFANSANTAATKHKKLTAQIDNLKERIGTALLPVIASLMTWINDRLIPAVTKFVGGLTGASNSANGFAVAGRVLRDVIKGVTAATKDAIGWATKHGTIVQALAVFIGTFVIGLKAYIAAAKVARFVTLLFDGALAANPIGIVIVAIAALAAVIVYLAKKTRFFQTVWADLKVAFKATLNFLTHGFGQLAFLILGPIPAAIIFLAIHWRAAWDIIRKVYSAAWNFIKRIGNDIKVFFVKTVPGWVSTMRNGVVGAYNSVVSHTHQWWSTVANFFTGTVKGFFTRTIPGWLKTLQNFFSSTWDHVLGRTKAFVNNDIIGNFNKFKNFFTSTVPGWIGTFKKKAVDTIKSTATGMWREWNKVANFLWTPISWVVENVYNKGIVKFWDNTVGKIPGIPHINAFHLPAAAPFKTGGQVSGKHGIDRIPASLTHGEYVINADRVRMFGSQFFDHLNFGPMNHGNRRDLPPTGDGSYVPTGGRRAFAKGGLAGIPGVSAKVPGTLNYLRSIANVIPYVLGGVGPRSFDCSGLVGEVWARLTGNPSFRRYFVTQTEGPWLLRHGFARGADPSGFTVGVTNPPEHTVGILAGHRFEAAHTGTRMRFDGAAGSAMNMASKYHMIGLSGLGGGGGVGYDPIIDTILKKTPAGYLKQAWDAMKHIPHPGLQNGDTNLAQVVMHKTLTSAGSMLGGLAQKAKNVALAAIKLAGRGIGAIGGFFKGPHAGANGGAWIKQAMAITKAPSSWLNPLEYIAQHESSGDPNAVDRILVAGQHAEGLMQMLPSTYNAYRVAAAPGGIFNPVSNAAASIKYIMSRYGTVFNTPWISGTGHYYDQGGILESGTAGFNTSGKPEAVLTQEQFAAVASGMTLNFNFYGPVTGNERDWIRKVMPTLRDEVIKATGHRGKPYFEK